ncbi:MAG: helix-turn-helix domain-containing protein [Dehalococcoidia bacterium]
MTANQPFHAGRALARLRHMRNWSQEDLARRLHRARQRVSQLEQSETFNQTADVLMLAEVFNVPPGYFMGPRALGSPIDDELLDLLSRRTEDEIAMVKGWLRLLDDATP